MAGYVVTVKHLGKHYDIRVSDSEVQIKMAQFKRDCPQLAAEVTVDDIAEMVAHDKAVYAIDLTADSRQRWVRGEKCAYCGAGHRMVTATLTSGTLANILFKSQNILGDLSSSGIKMPEVYVCEKCFETEFSTCKKCKRDLPNKEVVAGLCSLCMGEEAPLTAKRVQVT